MRYLKRNALGLLFTILIFVIIIAGLRTMNASTAKNGQATLEKAMRRGIMECYVMEGHYPKSLNDLKKHYHVSYNEKDYQVTYHYKNSYTLPTFTITTK